MVHRLSPLAVWPWEWLGTYKYWICMPVVLKVAHAYFHGALAIDDWCLHVLIISVLRCVIYEAWNFVSRSRYLFRSLQIRTETVEFEQVDREFDWDNYILLQACLAAAIQNWIPTLSRLPIWDSKGVVFLVLLHTGPVELAYYVIHRTFHNSYLFERYHSLHHASVRTEPSSAGTSTFLEHFLMTVLMAVPLAGVYFMGYPSLGMFYLYILGYDFVKMMIHSNVEVVPLWPFSMFPFLKYFLITPSYHTAHHTGLKANFCLFMPLYDYLGGTIDESSYQLHANLRIKGQSDRVPDLIFLAHGVDLISCLHLGCYGRTFASVPFAGQWYVWFFWPFTWSAMFLVWILKYPYEISSYRFRNVYQQSWVLPRLGFQYLLPFAFKDINAVIERTILDCDRKGVKVITLGAMNKNEAMNRGGAIFAKKHEDLKVRICHGNTLTTAVILRELPANVTEVFLTGATSKIGKAIALYLCRKRVWVLMLTNSRERFNAVVSETAVEFREYLVQVTTYEAGRNCKTWIVGKWAGYGDQKWAPSGTHFHQFTIPEIFHFRKDCTYGALAGLKVPSDLKGMNTCEYTMPRRAIHACHAGGLIHCLEGWTEHEVGAIDVDKIDVVWDAAMKYGFSLV